MSFPLGFWNYSDIEKMDASCVRDWADAGMTVAMSPNFDSSPESLRRIGGILDAAKEAGVKVILCHRQAYWPHLTKAGEEAYRRDFAAAVKSVGSHPAVFGFHVGDEPGTAEFDDACRAIRIQKELAPHLKPFCNLLPWHEGIQARIGYADFDAYLDAYVAAGKPDLLCYDCYSQMKAGTEGWDMYFRNLRHYQQAAERNSLPYWTTLLSVGHYLYRCPREDDIRWQVYTSLAHGAAGLLWFFFYQRQPHDNYRVAPIDEHGERTETYQWLSRINRSLLKGPGPVLEGLRLKRVEHVGKAWGGWPAFDGHGRFISAKSRNKTDLILSEFADADGRCYLAVTNNSNSEPTQVELTIGGRQPKLFRPAWLGGETPVTAGDGWQTTQGRDHIAIRPWLSPGQMELYRLEEGNS